MARGRGGDASTLAHGLRRVKQLGPLMCVWCLDGGMEEPNDMRRIAQHRSPKNAFSAAAHSPAKAAAAYTAGCAGPWRTPLSLCDRRMEYANLKSD
eukprot:CAMPEP_0119363836 /NCGR_PEP_ID=MMETSP1334-20130426/10753_1 /TAXON_ID=127549 /ORGANISM="Calcidiscus leptoporus, Strain RCC1130" /LENGTH=95 /DNA_ID=CAMNT_0007379385 /DNA_START=205 /DNA_END=489 /DNA_ORIENTATION=-